MSRRLIRIVLLVNIILVTFSARSAYAAQTAPGPLGGLLNQVPDSNISRTVIWYGSLGDFERLLGITLNSPSDFMKLSREQQTAYLLDANQTGKQIYYSPFSGLDKYATWQKTFGINPYSIDREVTVGGSPNWYALLVGKFQSSAIVAALQKLGYKSAQVGNVTIYSSDNGQALRLAGSVYNRLVVSDTQIIAAPSDPAIQAVLPGSGNPLGADPTYAALVSGLEGTAAIPAGTQLLSAAVFDGSYLIDKVITSDPLAASVGKTLNANQLATLRSQLALKNEKLLPRYKAAAIGYRRTQKDRFFTIVLVYDDPAMATQANQILTDRLPRYGSFQQNGRQLFAGWSVTSKITAANNLQVLTVALQLPAQTDVSWIDLITNHDIGFLAAGSQ